MSVVTDVWNYLLSGASSPWALYHGDPSISSSKLQVTGDDIVVRTNLSGGMVTDFLWTCNSSNTEVALSLWGGAGPSRNFALNWISNQFVVKGASYNAGYIAGFGGIPGTIASTDQTIRCQFFVKPTAQVVAVKLTTTNGQVFSSGFVSYTALVWERLVIFSPNTSTGSAVYSSFGSLLINYALTDAEVQALYDGTNAFGVSDGGVLQNNPSPPRDIKASTPMASAKTTTQASTPSSPNQVSHEVSNPDHVPTPSKSAQSTKLPASSSDLSRKFNSSWTAIFEDDGVPYTTFSQPQPLDIVSLVLNLNKEITVSANQVSDTPVANIAAVVYKAAKPEGGFTYDFRSSDILKTLMAHYQLGTAAATSNPFKYHFYPNKKPLNWGVTGTFCKGAYSSVEGRPYSVSVLKKVIDTNTSYGGTNAVFYKHGVCHKLDFSLQTGDDAKAHASFKFRDLDYGTAVSANPNSAEVGSYATTPSFVSTGASVTIAGTQVDISSFTLSSEQAVQEFTRVGRQAPENYNFSSYTAKGVFTFDLPLDAMKEVGSMFGSQTFSFLATVANSASDRVIFDLPNCRRLPFDFNAQSGDASVKGQIPFEAFETNGTYPMRVTVDTGYSFSALLT